MVPCGPQYLVPEPGNLSWNLSSVCVLPGSVSWRVWPAVVIWNWPLLEGRGRVAPSMSGAGRGTPTRGLGVESSEPVSTGTCCLASCRSRCWNSLFVRWRQILNLWVVIRECIYWPIFMSDLCSSWRPRCQRGPRGRGRGRGHVVCAFILLTAVYLCLFSALISTVYLNICDGLNMSAAMRSHTAAVGG